VTPRRSASFDPLRLAPRGDAGSWAELPADATSFAEPPSPRAALVATLAAAAAATPAVAAAKGGEYGLAEGRIISLAHPVAMGGCFLATLFAGFTGYQWRRLREVGVELKAAKATLKAATLAATPAEEGAPVEDAHAAALAAAEAEVATLTAARSEIADGNFRDKHYSMGTILLAVGIPMALEGPVNTYMRAGKLFPGPHVYAGVGVGALWAIAAACVPEMQKGKEWARNLHIGCNAVTFALFAGYQIPTGLEIAAKVIEKTKFP